MSRTIVDGVPYRTVRTLPSPNTNCGPPAELGEPQLPPPQDSLPTLHPAPDARSGNPFSCESLNSPSPQRPTPPVPPITIGSSQYHVPAATARAAIAFSPKKMVFDVPSAIDAWVETLPQFDPYVVKNTWSFAA